jgi:cell division protein FtsA
MMNTEKIAVGLDIGTTKIVCAIGKLNEHAKIEILGVGQSKSTGVQDGVVVNIVLTEKAIKEAVEEAEEQSGLKVHSVVAGIAGKHIRSLQHSDYVTRTDKDEDVIEQGDIDDLIDNVHKLVMMPGEEIIHVLPQEYKIDGQTDIKHPIGMHGSRLEANLHLVVGQTSSIRNIGRSITNAGLELKHITLEPLASASSTLAEEEKEAGVALIDIGGGTTDLAIFKDGIIRHTAVIPMGGKIITNDIKEGCEIIERQAELLKIKFGSTWPAENSATEIITIPGLRGREPKEVSKNMLSQIIHARVKEIIVAAHAQILGYGHEQQNKRLIAGLVLTGGGSQLKHIKQLIEFETGMSTRIGYPNEHLANKTEKSLMSPMYATAIGLLIKGLESTGSQNMATDPDAIPVPEEKPEPIATATAEETQAEKEEQAAEESSVPTGLKGPNFLEKWFNNLKEFLNNDIED